MIYAKNRIVHKATHKFNPILNCFERTLCDKTNISYMPKTNIDAEATCKTCLAFLNSK